MRYQNHEPAQIAALEAGETYYKTARRCKNGHLDLRYSNNSCCKVCVDNRLVRIKREKEERGQLEVQFDRQMPCSKCGKPLHGGYCITHNEKTEKIGKSVNVLCLSCVKPPKHKTFQTYL